MSSRRRGLRCGCERRGPDGVLAAQPRRSGQGPEVPGTAIFGRRLLLTGRVGLRRQDERNFAMLDHFFAKAFRRAAPALVGIALAAGAALAQTSGETSPTGATPATGGPNSPPATSPGTTGSTTPSATSPSSPATTNGATMPNANPYEARHGVTPNGTPAPDNANPYTPPSPLTPQPSCAPTASGAASESCIPAPGTTAPTAPTTQPSPGTRPCPPGQVPCPQ